MNHADPRSGDGAGFVHPDALALGLGRIDRWRRAPFATLVDTGTYRNVAARWAAQNFVMGGVAGVVGGPAVLILFGHLDRFRPMFVVLAGCSLIVAGGVASFLFRRSMRAALLVCACVTSVVMAVFSYGAGTEVGPAVAEATMMTAASAPLLYRRRNALLILATACATSAVAFLAMPDLTYPGVRVLLLCTQVGIFAALMLWLVSTLLSLAESESRALHDTEELRRQLSAADLRRRNFLHHMSHQLRTPLNAIIGFSEMLRSGLAGELTDKQTEYVGDISSSGRHLLSLVDEVLDVGQVEQGELELNRLPFPVARVVEESVALCRGQAQRRNVTLVCDTVDAAGELVADERKVKQVLLNLLSNAIKFTPSGGEVDLSVEARVDTVVFRVRDSGPGVSSADADRIFRAYERAAGTKAPGTGLGLAVARRIAEAHGGSVRLAGRGLGHRGATFMFTLPRTGDNRRARTAGMSGGAAPDDGHSGRLDPGIFDDGSALAQLIGDEGLARLRSLVMGVGAIFESLALAATVPLSGLHSSLWDPVWIAVAVVGLLGGIALVHPRSRLSARTMYLYMCAAVAATGWHMWSFGSDLGRSLAVILVLEGMAAVTFFRARRALVVGLELSVTYAWVVVVHHDGRVGFLRMAITLGIVAGGSMMARWLVRFLPALANAEARARREAELVNIQLEAASRHKSEFLASMTHELRTPLNAIIGFADGLEQGVFGSLTEKQSEYIADISAAGNHLLAVIDDVLDLARADAGRLEFRPRETTLVKVLNMALAAHRRRESRVATSLPTDSDSLRLYADPDRLAQAVCGLVDNALDLTPPDELVRVTARTGLGTVVIEVSDPGPEIPPADRAQIFAPFEQVSDRGSEGRNGLGLALARQLVALNGGTLTLHSRPGRNVFTVTLRRWPQRRPGDTSRCRAAEEH